MKLKTNKAAAKRFKLTKKKKIIKRTAGQDHFNSQERGNTTRNKRRDKKIMNKADAKTIKRLIAQF
ncbi:50S ribosomal protein L35 [Candidatus Parcubacteria bacterium]|nr:50S ribosomal protein L35 [Candidatus Parcubacteria bacterium]